MSSTRPAGSRWHAPLIHATLILAVMAVALVPTATTWASTRPHRWTARASMSAPRAFHTATLLRNGRVLVAGGVTVVSTTEFIAVDSAELYTPWTNTWTTVPPMTMARANHTATLLLSGKVLVAGGGTSSAEVYTPWTNTWASVAPMHYPRSQATATRLLNGKVLVVGDRLGGPGGDTPEIYTPWTNTWALASALPGGQGRCGGHTADLLGTGRVLVTGGCATFGGTTDQSFEYAPMSNAWLTPATGSIRQSHTSTKLLDGSVLVAGGFSLTGEDAFTEAEIYDPSTATWTAVSSMGISRSGHVAAMLLDGRVLVAGGLNNAETAGMSAELYDPVSDTWTTVDPMGSLRVAGASATRLMSGRVLVVGGLSGIFGPTLSSAEVFESAGT
jgi:hypothetical protein